MSKLIAHKEYRSRVILDLPSSKDGSSSFFLPLTFGATARLLGQKALMGQCPSRERGQM